VWKSEVVDEIDCREIPRFFLEIGKINGQVLVDAVKRPAQSLPLKYIQDGGAQISGQQYFMDSMASKIPGDHCQAGPPAVEKMGVPGG